ncbi:hypothetical protein [Neobacillus drentensis]|uniref:hypothetical protein n=1 Tax=Neobacillus drentensis TaxID=220684 RepID=UPI0030027732
MVYIQTAPNPNCPGLAADENGKYSGRNYMFAGGGFTKAPEVYGNFMIPQQLTMKLKHLLSHHREMDYLRIKVQSL